MLGGTGGRKLEMARGQEEEGEENVGRHVHSHYQVSLQSDGQCARKEYKWKSSSSRSNLEIWKRLKKGEIGKIKWKTLVQRDMKREKLANSFRILRFKFWFPLLLTLLLLNPQLQARRGEEGRKKQQRPAKR